MQSEVEKYVKNILLLYVSSWAEQISKGQTLDKEIQNDLRRILTELTDNLRQLDFQALVRDGLQIVRFHYQKILSCDGSKDLESNFQFSHPLLVQSNTNQNMELYFRSITQFLFGHLQVSSTISTKVVFDVVVDIIAKQVLQSLFDTYSDPLFWKSLLIGETHQNLLKETRKEDGENTSVSDNLDKHPRQYRKSKSEVVKVNRPIANQKLLARKTTLDLTGYSSVQDSAPGFSRESQTSGKISNALGETTILMAHYIKTQKCIQIFLILLSGGLFSATAGPLLPDNIAFKSFNKMWRSNSNESFQLDSPKKTKNDTPSPLAAKVPVLNSPDLSHPKAKPSDTRQNKSRRRHSSVDMLTDEAPNHVKEIINNNFQTPEEGDPLGDSLNYEESDNLENSISKLRALLDKRQRSDSGSNDSVFMSQEGDENLHRDKNILDVKDVPTDGRLIIDIKIPEIEVPTLGEAPSFSGEEDYPLFCIHYDGIYVEPTLPGSSFRYILQPRVVKRKFKEFLNLHARLEDNAKLRAEIKGIKNPSKWLNLPFSKHSEQSLENKRLFLEKWLVTLCHQPSVAVSRELGDFLAYGNNGQIEYAKKSGSDESKIDRVR